MQNTLATITPKQAQAVAEAFAKAYPTDAVAKRFDTYPKAARFVLLTDAVAWFTAATPAQRSVAIRGEAVSGWFYSDDADDDTADEDGDFISTPCYSCGDNLEDILHDLDHASRCGLLLLDNADLLTDPAEFRELEAALADLQRLDANGWASVTDGSLDGYSVGERLEIVRNALAALKA